MRDLWKWIGRHPILIGFGAIGFLLVCFVIWNVVRPAEDQRVSAIRKAGFPVTYAELDRWYPRVPNDENAALWINKALATSLTRDWPIIEDILNDKQFGQRKQPLPPAAQATLTSLFATNQETFALLFKATNCSGSRYLIDFTQGYNVPLLHLSSQKQVQNLLTLKALLEASRGQTQECAASLITAAHTAEALKQEPLLISQLVRIACWAVLAKRVELVLNLTPLPEPELTALQASFAAAGNGDTMARAMAGERVWGLAVFIDPPTQASLFTNPAGGGMLPSGLAGRALFAGMKASGLLRKDRNFFLDAMATNIAVSQLPLADRFRFAGQSITPMPTNRFMLFSRMLLPALGRAIERDTEFQARLRTAGTAFAVERFRQAHEGRLPQTLDDLVPAFLPSVPQDLDGKPLRYRLLSPGYVVYSIGTDGRDDGGTERNPDKRSAAHDLTFIVER